MKLFKTFAKIAAAPAYIPYKAMKMADDTLKKLNGPSTYNWWYHDGGQGEPPDDYEPNKEE